jgi:hypothetical protein
MTTVNNEVDDLSRRTILKTAAYVTPAILTLRALPAFASHGSGWSAKGNNGVGNGEDPQPPGNPPINDGPGTGPGNPGAQGNNQGAQANKEEDKEAGGSANTATGGSANNATGGSGASASHAHSSHP